MGDLGQALEDHGQEHGAADRLLEHPEVEHGHLLQRVDLAAGAEHWVGPGLGLLEPRLDVVLVHLDARVLALLLLVLAAPLLQPARGAGRREEDKGVRTGIRDSRTVETSTLHIDQIGYCRRRRLGGVCAQ